MKKSVPVELFFKGLLVHYFNSSLRESKKEDTMVVANDIYLYRQGKGSIVSSIEICVLNEFRSPLMEPVNTDLFGFCKIKKL